MNQAILFNDDHQYDSNKGCWVFTGLQSGQLLTIYMSSRLKDITQEDKFEWEEAVEDWLKENEPDQDNNIYL